MKKLTKKESKKRKLKKDDKTNSPLKTVSTIALLGEIFGKTDKEKNDWKKRMLGTIHGLSFPDDFDTLPEKERSRRLDGVINIGLGKK